MQYDSAELLEVTTKLIAYKSISPDHAGSLDYIASYLSNLGFTIKRLDRGDTCNLLASIGTGAPIVAFAGHVDVVPPGCIADWQYDPFTLTAANDKLYGRGIADMKGAVSAFMLAAKEFLAVCQDAPAKLNGSIMLLLTADEEAAATNGTIVMVEYLKSQNIRLQHCILGEPSSAKILGDVIRVGRRGSLTCHLEIVGKQGHVAYPTRCDNPVHKFAPVLDQLLNTTWDNGSELFPPTTMQITNINAGLGVDNVTPASLLVRFNFRFNDLHTADSLKNQVVEILDTHRLNYHAQWIIGARPFCSKSGQLTTAISEIMQARSGITVLCDTGGGTSDGRFLIDVCDEIVELGLLNESIHQVNEWVSAPDLVALKDIYSAILQRLLN